MCLITNQSDTKCIPNPYPTTKQHAIVNIKLSIVARHRLYFDCNRHTAAQCLFTVSIVIAISDSLL